MNFLKKEVSFMKKGKTIQLQVAAWSQNENINESKITNLSYQGSSHLP